MKTKPFKQPKPPYHFKLYEGHAFRKDDVIIIDRSNTRYLIIDDNCKDAAWKKRCRQLRLSKILRFFKIDITDYTGQLKIIPVK